MDWVPRPPHPDEPACWSWLIPALPGLAPEHTRRITHFPESVRRERDFILVLGSMQRVDAGPEGARFNAFHDGRCAICGSGGWIDDHCHSTGQARGLLCNEHNFREGRSRQPLYVRYRRLHPAAILGYYERYNGAGWYNGWSNRDHPAPWMLEPRPLTPWPAWTPDMPLNVGLPGQRDGDDKRSTISRRAGRERRAQ